MAEKISQIATSDGVVHDIAVPTKTSDLTNDSNFLTSSDVTVLSNDEVDALLNKAFGTTSST